MTALPLNIRVEDIDQCGIVEGICDEMGLVTQVASYQKAPFLKYKIYFFCI